MVQETASQAIASTVRELQCRDLDPQSVLTRLVELHGLLSSTASSVHLVLAEGPPHLSDAVNVLQQVLQDNLHIEEEVVWYVCRVVSVGSRASHRFKLQAGHLRLWETLLLTRAAYPESPRILEASLEATVSLFHGVELHQLWATSQAPSQKELVIELVQLMDRLDSPPARLTLLSPQYDFSRLVVLALAVLCRLFASPRIVATSAYGTHDHHSQLILKRMRPMLPHFLKTSDASRTWLAMARLQLQYAPPIALQILFVEDTVSPSWCLQLVNAWHADHLVVYDFATLFTQVFAVPQGSKRLPATVLGGHVARAMMHHGLLDLLISLLHEYFAPMSKSQANNDHCQSVLLEIVRSIRQFSCVPEMLAAFPTLSLAKTSLVPALIAGVDLATSGLGKDTGTPVQYHMRLLLELLLTLQQLTHVPIIAREIQKAESLTSRLAQASKHVDAMQKSMPTACLLDAGASDLPAVLLRELQKTTTAITGLPTSSLTSGDKLKSSSTRGLQRLLPSSSSKRGGLSTLRAAPTASSATNSAFHTLSSSHSSSSLTLARTSSQRKPLVN
jgi:hypothetical protein